MKQGKPGVYARYIKRILDVLLSGCALVVLTPVLLIVAVLVRTKLGSPVIFCQERPGKDEKIFKMYKFRSMTDQRDENGELVQAGFSFNGGAQGDVLGMQYQYGQNLFTEDNKVTFNLSLIHI